MAGGSEAMRDNDRDPSRPRPKKKVSQDERPVAGAPLRMALLGGGGLLVVGLLSWGVWRLVTGGSPVVAQARPADEKAVQKPVSNDLPLEQIPSASGWKVTPDGLPLASGLTSAVVLPEGDVNQVRFSNPAEAQAAVVIARGPLPPPPNVVVNNYPTYPLEWAQVDLKGGRVVGQVSVGNSQPGGGPVKGLQVTNAALSPTGERLAVVVPAVGGAFVADETTLLQVWDKAGKKLLERAAG
jgi:hypothetical protein